MTIPVWLPSWQHDGVEIKSSDYVYKGFFKVQQLQLRHQCFSGEWSPWLQREQVHHSDAAAVLLVDPLLQKLVLVEQFRVGLLKRDGKPSPWLLEIVAGLLEPNEKPEQTIMREAMEEAGCKITQLLKIGEFYNSPGGFAEKTTLYCGIVDSTGVGGVHGVGKEHEDIQVHVLNIKEVLSFFEAGKLITSSSTVIALQWLAFNLKSGHDFLKI